MINVRPAEERDRAAFLEMWDDFVALAPDEPGNRGMGMRNWKRIGAEGLNLHCIVCGDAAGAPIGFTLYSVFPFTWSRGDVCYLQDIYVRAEARGQGAARAMMAHLKRLGEEAGWFKVFWMTQPDNFAAQRLYEKIAKRMDYLRYDMNVGDP